MVKETSHNCVCRMYGLADSVVRNYIKRYQKLYSL